MITGKSKKNRTLLITKIGGNNYGVWKDDFKSIEEGKHIFNLPLTPPHFAGIIDIEGQTLSLFDLAVLIGLPPMHSYEKNSLFIMSDRSLPLAFVTEGVCAEHDIPYGDIMPMPGYLISPSIDSCVVKGDELIPVINLSTLSNELSSGLWKGVELPTKLPDELEEHESDAALRLFTIGDEMFAAAGIDAKNGLMEVGTICHLPFAPDFVMGVTLLKGTVVTIIDTLSILGVKTSGNEVRVLLSEIGGDSFGFVVDSDDGAADKTKSLPLPPIAEREWIRDIIVNKEELIPLIRLPELLFSHHDELDKEALEKKYSAKDLVETKFGKATIDLSQIKLAGNLHALPGLEVKDTLPYRPCRRLPHLPSIIQGVVEHNGKILPLLDMGACFQIYSRPTGNWKMVLVENGDFSALVLTESAPKEKSLPPHTCWTMPIAMDRKFIYGCYPDSENSDVRLVLNVFELAVFFDEKAVKDVFAFTLDSAKEIEASEIEAEKLEAEKLEAEKLEAEKLEAEKLEAEKIEAEKIEAEKIEAEKLEAEKIEAEKIEAEKIEAEKLEAEKLEAEKLEAEKLEAEKIEAEKIEAEQLEAEQLEAEKIEAEKIEAEKIEAEKLEAEKLEAEKIEAERLEAEKLEAERLEAEKLEAEKLEAEKLEAEQLEAEKVEAEKVEAEQLEAEQLEAEKVEAEKIEAEVEEFYSSEDKESKFDEGKKDESENKTLHITETPEDGKSAIHDKKEEEIWQPAPNISIRNRYRRSKKLFDARNSSPKKIEKEILILLVLILIAALTFLDTFYGDKTYKHLTALWAKTDKIAAKADQEEVISPKPPIAAVVTVTNKAPAIPAIKSEVLPKNASKKRQPKTTEIVLKKPTRSPVPNKPAKKKKRKKVYPPLGEFDFYTVVKGDTLWDIADAYTNNPYDYHLVAEGNRVINPDLIEPGLKLRLKKNWKEKYKKSKPPEEDKKN